MLREENQRKEETNGISKRKERGVCACYLAQAPLPVCHSASCPSAQCAGPGDVLWAICAENYLFRKCMSAFLVNSHAS